MAQITYDDKVYLNENASVPAINKVQDIDMNEIKSVINGINDGTDVVDNLVVGSIRTKNIFGSYSLRNGYITGTTMSIHLLGNNRMAFIQCKPNTTYTISRSVITSNFRVASYDGDTVPPMLSTEGFYTVQETVQNNSASEITYTTNSTAKWLVIHYGYLPTDGSTLLSQTLASMQVEEGDTATEYSPYQQLDCPDISLGTATVNNTYISSAENNHYEKYGRVVSYSFTMTVKGSWNTTTQFLSGLPGAKRYTRFMALDTTNQTVIRLGIDGNGNITNAYSNTTPSANHVIEGHVTYIASE